MLLVQAGLNSRQASDTRRELQGSDTPPVPYKKSVQAPMGQHRAVKEGEHYVGCVAAYRTATARGNLASH